MADTWKLITDRMRELSELHERMDKSKDLAYLEPYELKDFKGKKEDHAIHVTGNKAAVFGHTIVADLIKGNWQTIIEGKLTARQAHLIEQFIDDNLDQADEYLLARYGIVGLHEWLCNHVCIRGPIGVEWCSWVDEDQYNIHCLPVDMRWTPFRYGKWVAPITFPKKDELLGELERKFPEKYPELKDKIKGDKEIEVRDFWDEEKNELWIDKVLALTQPNPFGKPPFAIAFPPSGFMLRDKGYMKYEGEDIFYLIRGLNDELNRSLSIEQSIGMDVLKPPYMEPVEVMDASPANAPPKTAQTKKVKKGLEWELLPRGDLNRASQFARQDIMRMIDEGAPTAPRMYTQPPSGAELIAEMEALARLQGSRLVALKVLREQLARMMIEQYIKVSKDGSELSIGKRGRKRGYSAAQLKDPDTYSISCQLMTKSKRQELANLAMFDAAYNRLPLRYNLTNILMAEDPDGIMRELDIEQAKKADPAINLFEMARRYAQEANETEDDKEADALKIQSQMLTERGVAIIRERKMPQQLPEQARVPQVEQPTTTGQISQMLPLMGGGSPRKAEMPEEIL